MSIVDRLERDLTEWFSETAVRETPDLAEDILIETSGLRQRPRWTFVPPLPRPMDRPLVPSGLRTVPQRRLAILVAIAGLLVLVAGAALVASRPPLPTPFGPAANGLVAYAKGGDIFLVVPATGERVSLVVGPDVDRHPRWSLDGTRLAFVRQTASGERLVIVDVAGTVQTVSGGYPLPDVDPDGIAWAPDGEKVMVKANLAYGGVATDPGSRHRPRSRASSAMDPARTGSSSSVRGVAHRSEGKARVTQSIS